MFYQDYWDYRWISPDPEKCQECGMRRDSSWLFWGWGERGMERVREPEEWVDLEEIEGEGRIREWVLEKRWGSGCV